jgi:hypothetical protein
MTIKYARSVSNQLSNYGGVQTWTHPARRGPGRRSIRTYGRPPGLLRDEEVAGTPWSAPRASPRHTPRNGQESIPAGIPAPPVGIDEGVQPRVRPRPHRCCGPQRTDLALVTSMPKISVGGGFGRQLAAARTRARWIVGQPTACPPADLGDGPVRHRGRPSQMIMKPGHEPCSVCRSGHKNRS